MEQHKSHHIQQKAKTILNHSNQNVTSTPIPLGEKYPGSGGKSSHNATESSAKPEVKPGHGGSHSALEDGIYGSGFKWCISFLEKRGKELYGDKFRIFDKDHEIIFKLLVYFIADKSNAEKLDIDLQKGILLSGPVGCGKTSLMSIMRFVPPPERNHTMRPCRDISFEFIQEGYEVIWRYSKMSFNSSLPKIFCFDDLGTEQSLKYYGNECNVMGEILLSRYDLFVTQRMITHVTTNLSASELEAIYGNRVRSRMRQLFNLIAFDKEAPDKRS